ncbi:hypothetical protein [Halomonas campaniensis]|uniref:Uncharacterized protein n=1 Tax=Halomonas campaniensis TaxID=213554 RepID=A0A246RVB7_9GAMM|nr:hypothetical protein [Halomonas campaniensis]OWV28103.1 hypothetical protein JI62_17305 [Halomonas campaniensis]
MGSFWGAVVGAICAVVVTTMYHQWRHNVEVSRELFKNCQKTKKDFALIANGYLDVIEQRNSYQQSLDFLIKNNVLQSDAQHDLRAILEVEPLFSDQKNTHEELIVKIQELTKFGTGVALNHPLYLDQNAKDELLVLKGELTNLIDEVRNRAIKEAKVTFLGYCIRMVSSWFVKAKEMALAIWMWLTNLPERLR